MTRTEVLGHSMRAIRGMTVASASTRRIDQWRTRHGLLWKVTAVALGAVAVGALAVDSSRPTFITAELALVIMAVAAGLFASVTTTP